jgi:two-component system nitrogen regulation response regulator GlnG
MPYKILIIDDDASLRFVLERALTRAGHVVTSAASADEAATVLQAQSFQLAFVDILMPGTDGLEFVRSLKNRPNSPAMIVMTAQNTVKNAIEAMKAGAFDYITKPFELDEVLLLAEKAGNSVKQQEELVRLRAVVEKHFEPGETIIGESAKMRDVYKVVGKVASSDVTVLIQGESGTGKELVARAIHYHSQRAAAPFITVNAAAIPHELLESELFGHERGAFTGAFQKNEGKFQLANGGTLFLDEIGDMPADLQVKLLRALQEKEITPLGGRAPIKTDVRVIAATNANLANAVRTGAFREDLFYRLNVVPILLPPLRERSEDVPLLASFFLRRYATELGYGEKRLSAGAQTWLREQAWPGNVRELENLVKRVALLATGQTLTQDDFQAVQPASTAAAGAGGDGDLFEQSFDEIIYRKLDQFISKVAATDINDLYETIIRRVERPMLEIVLRETKGNQIKAAEILGINRNTLRKKIQDCEIDLKEAKGKV